MPLTLKPNDGWWIQSPFGGDDVRFKMRDLTPQEESRIKQQVTTYRPVKKADGNDDEIITVVDEVLMGWLRFNLMVVDWEGIEGEDGKPIPCTEDSRLALFSQRGLEIMALFGEYAKIKAEEFKRAKDKLGKSVASSSTDSTSRELPAATVANG